MSSVFGFGKRHPPPPPPPPPPSLPIPLSVVQDAAANTVAWARHVSALLDLDLAKPSDLARYPETARAADTTEEGRST